MRNARRRRDRIVAQTRGRVPVQPALLNFDEGLCVCVCAPNHNHENTKTMTNKVMRIMKIVWVIIVFESVHEFHLDTQIYSNV